jgi:hypothetical protein
MVAYPVPLADTIVAPSGDATGVTDTAAINLLTQAGKVAQLGSGTYYTTNITLDSNAALLGVGPSTILQAVAGTTGAMIAVKTPASSVQVTVEHLSLIPNTGTLIGVKLDNTGLGNPDSRHHLFDVFVNLSGGDAFYFGAVTRGVTVIACTQYNSGGFGFNIQAGATDNFFTDCVSGPSTSHGWNILGGNNHFKGCKSFFAGYNGATWGTTQAGFYLNACTYNVFAACSAQQSALHGFDFQSAVHCTMCACDSDSNSAGTVGGVGVNTNSSTFCNIIGTSGNNNGSLTPAAQLYGYQVAGTQSGTNFYGNTVTGTSGRFNYVSGGGYMIIDGTQVDISGSGSFKAGLMNASGGISTAASAPIIGTPVAGTNGGAAVQLSDVTRDYMVYLQVGTAGTALVVTMGSTSAGTDVTIHASGVATAGQTVSFRLPAGWYFKWSATTATLAQSVAVGC